MAVPDFQSLMLPVLRALKDGDETVVRKVRERVVSAEGVTEKTWARCCQVDGKAPSIIVWVGRSATSCALPWWNGYGEACIGSLTKANVFWLTRLTASTSSTSGVFRHL